MAKSSTIDKRKEEIVKEYKGKIKVEENNKKPSEMILKFRQAIDIDAIVKLDPYTIKEDENIRRKIDRESVAFKQLVESIKIHGVLQSIVVEFREEDTEKYSLVCIAGNRRLAALKQSGIKEKIPAKLISPKRPGVSLLVALSENVNRKDLHFIEVADTYKAIQEHEGLNPKEIASRFDKSEKTVDRYLKVAGWSDEIKALILDNTDVFNFSFVKENYIDKKKTEGQILISIRKKIEAKTKNKTLSKQTRQGARTQRKRKLFDYFESKNLKPDYRTEIEKALEHLGLL